MKYSISQKLIIAVSYLFFSYLLVSCSGGETNVDKGLKTQELHFGNGTEPQDLDPHIVTGVPEHHIIATLIEGLTKKDTKDLSPIPAAAASWEISDDKKTYVFTLRKDAKWSNGASVTAHDFVYSWKRILSPALGAQYAYMLYYIKNAEAFNNGKITDFSQVGVKALDDLTLEVTLNNPTHFFLGLLSHFSTYPVHKATIEKFGKIDEPGTQWTRPGNFVGNGAFTLEKWELNRVITVAKNPSYWNHAKVKLNKIHFHPIEDMNSEERMFRSGQLHMTGQIPIEKIAKYRKENPETTHIHPYVGTYFYRINITQKPFDDPRVRRALAMSIDRQQITEKITKGGETPTYFFTPPDINGYTSRTKVPYDVEAAKKLLAEAGYPNGEGFPKFEILFNTSESHKKIAIAIQQMWKRNLNIDVQLLNQEWKVYLDSQQSLDYDVCRAAWIADYLDPINFLDMFVSNGGNNNTGWSNQQYDALIAQSMQVTDSAERYEILQQAEKILLEEIPLIPIYTYTTKRLVSTDVKNYHHNMLDRLSFEDMYLSREENSKK